MKASTKKLLLASVAIGVLTPFMTKIDIVHAASVDVTPSNSSDNEVEVKSILLHYK